MDLKESLNRLVDFAASWDAGDVIDEPSGLTADDLECLIEWIKAAQAGPQ